MVSDKSSNIIALDNVDSLLIQLSTCYACFSLAQFNLIFCLYVGAAFCFAFLCVSLILWKMFCVLSVISLFTA